MWFLAFDKNVLVHSNLVALIVVHIASRKWEEIGNRPLQIKDSLRDSLQTQSSSRSLCSAAAMIFDN